MYCKGQTAWGYYNVLTIIIANFNSDLTGEDDLNIANFLKRTGKEFRLFNNIIISDWYHNGIRRQALQSVNIAKFELCSHCEAEVLTRRRYEYRKQVCN